MFEAKLTPRVVFVKINNRRNSSGVCWAVIVVVIKEIT
jgi:hypothetical protein